MKKPAFSSEKSICREAYSKNKEHANLILLENLSRKSAYKNSSLKISDSFFDDSDMLSDYYLVVIYDKKSNVPLLTARYYFDKALIAKTLKGDENTVSEHTSWTTIDIDSFKDNELFLSDRLSGNIHSPLYRYNRDYIFLLFYSEILKYNLHRKFILMARHEKREKLLVKYVRMGLNIAGSTKHKGKEHWILLGDVSRSYSQIRKTTFANLFLIAKKIGASITTKQ